MGLTIHEVSTRLAAIDQLVAKIDQQHLLSNTQALQELKESLKKLHHRNYDPEAISEEELDQFERETCCKAVLDHLDYSATVYNVYWDRPSDSVPEKDPITWLESQCDRFIQPFIFEVDDIIKAEKWIALNKAAEMAALDKAATKEIAAQKAEKQSSKTSKKPKVSKVVVEIFDPDKVESPAQTSNPLLSWQLQELKIIFTHLKSSDYDQRQKAYNFKNASSAELVNMKLMTWRTQYQANNEQAGKLIYEVHQALTGPTRTDNDIKKQGELLDTSIKSLKKFNANREKLAEKILAEEKLAFPTEEATQQDLVYLKQQALASLKKELKTFIQHVIEINAKDKGTEVQIFTKFISQFVEDLTKSLAQGKPPLVNTAAVQTLKTLLSYHLEGSKPLFNFATKGRSVSAEVSPAAIDELLDNLFSVPSNSKKGLKENSREEIERIYSIRAKLQKLSIEKSTQCFNDQKIIDQSRKEIAAIQAANEALVTQLQNKITSLTEALGLKNKLIPFGSPLQRRINDQLNELMKLQSELNEFKNLIENKASSTSSSSSLRTLFKKITATTPSSPALQTLEEVTELKVSTEAELKEQEKTQAHLEQIAINLQENEVHKILAELDNFYQSEKETLYTTLQDKIDETRSALRSVDRDPVVELAAQIKLADEIGSTNDSLPRISAQVDDALTTLDTQIDEIKTVLLEESALQKEDINTKIRVFSDSFKTLDAIHNPFYADVKVLYEKIHLEHLHYQLHIEKLKKDTKGTEFSAWRDNKNIHYKSIQANTREGNELLKGANEIERRLRTEPYKVSFTVLNKLEKEFARIFDKHVKHAHGLSKVQKNDLIKIRDKLISPSEHTSEITESLQRIDPRLIKLKTIYAEFKSINDDYINRNFQPSADSDYKNVDQDYKDKLQQQASKSLRNCNMEKVSDGVRSKFMQWIRINIFKPLQNLGRTNPSVFFATTGASKTEKHLVDLGNETHDKLTRGPN